MNHKCEYVNPPGQSNPIETINIDLSCISAEFEINNWPSTSWCEVPTLNSSMDTLTSKNLCFDVKVVNQKNIHTKNAENDQTLNDWNFGLFSSDTFRYY